MTSKFNRFLILIPFIVLNFSCRSVAQTATQVDSNGSSQKFTVTLSQTHGVSTSVQRTPDMNVTTTAVLVLGPGSSTQQTTADGTSGGLKQSTGGTDSTGSALVSGQGVTSGISGLSQVNYGDGTLYKVEITPKDLLSNENVPRLGTASGSAAGSTSTTLSIESTNTNFVNSLIQAF